jgi:outer membrane protein TolC
MNEQDKQDMGGRRPWIPRWAVAALLLAGCATEGPKWTPETVAPPASPPAELQVAAPIESAAEPVQLPDPAPAAQSLPINRDTAILTAILNNRSAEVARFGPKIGETLEPEARAEFDPTLFGNLLYGHDERNTATASGSSGGSGIGTGSGGTGGVSDCVQQTIDIVTQIRNIVAAVEGTPKTVVKTDTLLGTVGVGEHLPTGADISLSGSAGTADTNATDRQGVDGWALSAAQPLLRGAGTGVNLVALRQARNRAAQSEYVFRQRMLELVRQTETAYWGLALAEKLLAIRRFGVTLAEEQLQRTEDLFEAEKIIQGDVMAARAERASRMADLADAQASLRSQGLAMVQLLNPSAVPRWNLDFAATDPIDMGQTALDADASEKLALQYRPELAQARLDQANAGLDVQRARNGVLPRLDLVGSYGSGNTSNLGALASAATSGTYLADSTSLRVGVQFEQPIMNRAENARLRRARLAEQQLGWSVSALEQNLAREVRQAIVDVDRQWQRIQATSEAVEARTEQLRVAQGRFEAGKTTNLDLLIVQRDFLQSEVDEATARIRHIQALTVLYAAEGTLLERRGISLELTRQEAKDPGNGQ